MKKEAKNLIDRVSVFHDSDYLAGKLRDMACRDDEDSEYNYYLRECAEQIDGLFELSMDLASTLERVLKGALIEIEGLKGDIASMIDDVEDLINSEAER